MDIERGGNTDLRAEAARENEKGDGESADATGVGMRSGREKGGEEGEESKSPSFSLSEQQKGLSFSFCSLALSLLRRNQRITHCIETVSHGEPCVLSFFNCFSH